MGEQSLEECIALTQQLLGSLIAKPKLTPALLSKPPVKFLRDIFVQVKTVTSFGHGAFSEEELETCHSSREAKLSFLSALVHLVAIAADESALLGTVRVAKVAAGLEPENTNLLLQKLHFAATDPSCRQRWEHAVQVAADPSSRVVDDVGDQRNSTKSSQYDSDPGFRRDSDPVTLNVASATPPIVVGVVSIPAPENVILQPEAVQTNEASVVSSFFPGLAPADREEIEKLSEEVVSFSKQLILQGKTRSEVLELAASFFPGQPAATGPQLETIAAPTKLSRDDFDLGRTVGTGAFGRVRMAKLKKSPKSPPFALKILKKGKIVEFEQAPNVKAERAILQMCEHPFIVNLVNSFQDQRHLYMVLEYVNGGELFSHLKKSGRFENEATKFYTAEIALALRYLHEHNVAYRDLKAENLLIDCAGHLKITDFGFAKIMEEKTWTIQGTPEYLAPEIIQSKGHGTPVDWWALGILTFEMLEGYPPFHDKNPDPAQARSEIYRQIVAGEVNFPSGFDPQARDLISRLLSVNPDKRCGSPESDMPDPRLHPWYSGLDWEAALRRELPAPFLPGLNAPDDTSMFEQYPESLDNAEEEDWASAVDAVELQNVLQCFEEFG